MLYYIIQYIAIKLFSYKILKAYNIAIYDKIINLFINGYYFSF